MLITIDQVLKYGDINKVLHVGAHMGEEYEDYLKLGAEVTYIEANSDLIPKLKRKCPKATIIHMAASDKSGYINFYRTNYTASNSVLEPNLNKSNRGIRVIERVNEPARTIDSLGLEVDFMNLDIQGGELKALIGAKETLKNVKMVYCEVHKKETYKQVPRINEIDDILSDFKRVETKIVKDGWGDALYVR